MQATKIGIYLLTMFCLILVGGGKNAEGAILLGAVAGLALVADPSLAFPRRHLFWLALIGLYPLLQILPFGGLLPDWRRETLEMGVHLPASISVSPWESFELWVTYVSIFILYLKLRDLQLGERERAGWLACFVSIVGLLGCWVVYANQVGASYGYQAQSHVFSFFPNRNQQGALFAVAGVVTLGLVADGLQKREWWRLALLGPLLAALLGIVYSISKAGLGLFGLGALAVAAYWGRRVGWKLALPAVGAGLVALALVVALFGQRLWGRVLELVEQAQSGGEGSFRVKIWQDSLDLLGENGLFGVGLEQFRSVYPLFRESAINDKIVATPDNEYIWLLTEFGIVGLIVICLLLSFCGRALVGRWKEEGAGVGFACLVGCWLFLLHGLVDFDLRIPGTAMVFFFLLALGSASGEGPEGARQRNLQLGGWGRALGIGFLASAGAWVYGSLTPAKTHSDEVYADALNVVVGKEDESEALADLDRAIEILPMRWRPYANRGFLLARRGELSAADRDFAIAGFLDTVTYEPAFIEGRAYLPIDQRRAYRAWREALLRYPDHGDVERVKLWMRGILRGRIKSGGDVRPEMLELVKESP